MYYSTGKSSSDKPIFLIVPSIFNSPEILFLNIKSNFIDHLKEIGDVYMLNWSEEISPDFKLQDYVNEIMEIIEFLNNKTSKKINLLGHCIGGNLCIAATILKSKLINNLTLLTVPWDFSHLSLINNLHRMIGLDNLVRSLPEIPKIYIKILFFLLFPNFFNTKIDKYFNFILEADKQLFIEVEHWLMSGNTIPKNSYLEIIDNMMNDNFLVKKKWLVNDVVIDPAHINTSTFMLIAKNDQLVPRSSVQPLYDSIKSLKLLELNGGHIGYLINTNINNFFNPYKLWLKGEF